VPLATIQNKEQQSAGLGSVSAQTGTRSSPWDETARQRLTRPARRTWRQGRCRMLRQRLPCPERQRPSSDLTGWSR